MNDIMMAVGSLTSPRRPTAVTTPEPAHDHGRFDDVLQRQLDDRRSRTDSAVQPSTTAHRPTRDRAEDATTVDDADSFDQVEPGADTDSPSSRPDRAHRGSDDDSTLVHPAAGTVAVTASLAVSTVSDTGRAGTGLMTSAATGLAVGGEGTTAAPGAPALDADLAAGPTLSTADGTDTAGTDRPASTATVTGLGGRSTPTASTPIPGTVRTDGAGPNPTLSGDGGGDATATGPTGEGMTSGGATAPPSTSSTGTGSAGSEAGADRFTEPAGDSPAAEVSGGDGDGVLGFDRVAAGDAAAGRSTRSDTTARPLTPSPGVDVGRTERQPFIGPSATTVETVMATRDGDIVVTARQQGGTVMVTVTGDGSTDADRHDAQLAMDDFNRRQQQDSSDSTPSGSSVDQVANLVDVDAVSAPALMEASGSSSRLDIRI